MNDLQVLEADSMADNADQNLESIMGNKMLELKLKTTSLKMKKN